MTGVNTKNRPLSPHLTIYRPQITSVLSITHRLTGFYLYIGLFVFSWLLIAHGFSDNFLAGFYLKYSGIFFASIVGKAAFLSWVFSLYYHTCNGIRHLVWDTGRGYSIGAVKISGLIVITASIALTLYSWHGGIINLIN